MSRIVISTADYLSIRKGLQGLPVAPRHKPGDQVDKGLMVVLSSHDTALDPDRVLVVGNRGVGKSFWAHALTQPAARAKAAQKFKRLQGIEAYIGFNASENREDTAPSSAVVADCLEAGLSADVVWRTVVTRAAWRYMDVQSPGTGDFKKDAQWVTGNIDKSEEILSQLDGQLANDKKKLLIVFDALERVADNWNSNRELVKALLKRALAMESYRAIRLKVFMRQDQYAVNDLFAFPDGSKIRNARVDLRWKPEDLYDLLFQRLKNDNISADAFKTLETQIGNLGLPRRNAVRKAIIDSIAGEFMGATAKRGAVFTWVPLHLSDAREETSPRTFQTAWRAAAEYGSELNDKSVDHLGLLAGVGKASEDRLAELKEDYQWIEKALDPLRHAMVPMEKVELIELWKQNKTIDQINKIPETNIPMLQMDGSHTAEEALLNVLKEIGVMEIRSNGKINVPDIFRVHAGIKRKGGVKPPRKST